MKWFGRQRRVASKPFDPSELPTPEPPSVDVGAAEGLMLAEYSSRMALKNRIIVGVLTRPDSYEAGEYIGEARSALETLVEESTRIAARIAEERRAAGRAPGRAVHVHDYQLADLQNLRHREAVAQALVAGLRERQDDPDFLAGLVEAARADAWSDIAKAIEDALDRSNIVVDATYEHERDERMRLVAEDLARLAAGSA